jgi:hypothetical protein
MITASLSNIMQVWNYEYGTMVGELQIIEDTHALALAVIDRKGLLIIVASDLRLYVVRI